MTNTIRILWLSLASAVLAPAVAEPEPLTLEQSIARALDADPRIDERKALVEAARALLQEAAGNADLRYDVNAFVGLAPGVDGGFFEGGANTNSCNVPPCTPRDDAYELNDGVSLWFNVQFRIIKPLYTFGKIENYAAAAQGNVDVKRAEVHLQRNQIRLDVARAYYGFLTARDTRYLLEDTMKRVERAENLVKEWLEEGRGEVKQSDLYALQTGAAVVGRYLAQAKAVERVALDGLKLLTGVGLGNALEVADAHIRPVPKPRESLDALQARALERRPEVQQLEAGLRARRALVAARKSDKNPNLYAGIVGTAAYAPRRDRLDNPYLVDPFNHYAATPVLGVQWEWASGVQPARVAQAQAELNALVQKASFARNGIPFQVAQAFYEMEGSHEAAQRLTRGSRSGRRWLVSRYADFEAGLETPDKVLEALQGYVLAHSDYLASVNEYNVHVMKLMTVSGGFQ